MGDMSAREHKKAVSALAFFEREVEWCDAAAVAQDTKADGLGDDMRRAREAAGAARVAASEARGRVTAARGVVDAATVTPVTGSGSPTAGAAAHNPTIITENGA